MEKKSNDEAWNSSESEALVEFLTSGPQLQPSSRAHKRWEKTVQQRAVRPLHVQSDTAANRWRWAAVAGWVATAGLATLYFTSKPTAEQPVVVVSHPPRTQAPPQAAPQKPTTAPAVTKTNLVQELDTLRKEVAALKENHKPAPKPRNNESRFTIFELSKNGKGKTASQPTAFSSQRLAGYLHRGIEREMDDARLSQVTPGEALVGPTYGSWDGKLNSSVLVFPNFPQDQWESLGLLRGQAGVFYDPERGLLWQPSSELANTWKGLPVERSAWLVDSLHGSPTLAANTPAVPTLADPPPESLVASNSRMAASDPTLIVTMDQKTGEGTLLTQDLPALPDGQVYGVAINNASTNTSVEVGTLAPGLAGSLTANFSVNDLGLTPDGVSVFPKTVTTFRGDSVPVSSTTVITLPDGAYSAGFIPTSTASSTTTTTTTPATP